MNSEQVIVERLKAVWRIITQKVAASEDIKTRYFEEIINSYKQANRHYHNLKHLDELFALLYPHESNLQQAHLVYFAVFYHDIIYNPLRQDNELKSAKVAEKRLTELGQKVTDIAYVYDLIIATKTHEAPAENPDFYYLLDADLAILGTPQDTYEQYTKAIRKEYSWYPDMLYYSGRKKVLQHFLHQKDLFYTTAFREKFDAQARENLTWEIERLG